ncbi:hypothetical protein QYE76_004131 [Lolium multiflorum]|uniref:Uncharacterized protein n=1 Tax=Lolium multiflorum TaxID=4521 RepID=A0AAD8RTY0_LOLMU|nr:hypothetical protein QYE76_004131 [Lolium multiflorum]
MWSASSSPAIFLRSGQIRCHCLCHIPATLVNLTSLQELQLSANKVSGLIPRYCGHGLSRARIQSPLPLPLSCRQGPGHAGAAAPEALPAAPPPPHRPLLPRPPPGGSQSHAQWREHRSSMRHLQHLLSSLSSRVILSLITPVSAFTAFAAAVAAYNMLVPDHALNASPFPTSSSLGARAPPRVPHRGLLRARRRGTQGLDARPHQSCCTSFFFLDYTNVCCSTSASSGWGSYSCTSASFSYCYSSCTSASFGSYMSSCTSASSGCCCSTPSYSCSTASSGCYRSKSFGCYNRGKTHIQCTKERHSRCRREAIKDEKGKHQVIWLFYRFWDRQDDVG